MTGGARLSSAAARRGRGKRAGAAGPRGQVSWAGGLAGLRANVGGCWAVALGLLLGWAAARDCWAGKG
jgi:hypothetical protein